MKNFFKVTIFSIITPVVMMMYITSCKKKPVDVPYTALTTQDSMAAVYMRQELLMMHHANDSMMASVHHSDQVHWDSIYHHHDSLFWEYHSDYHHETYTHDDHHHEWVPYDSSDHTHHYHHTYPDHPHDSLATTTGDHHDDNSDHHHHGHDIDMHTDIDDLHHTHVVHHP